MNTGFFTPFTSPVEPDQLPRKFVNPFDSNPHPLCIQAALSLQKRIPRQHFPHNFGLDPNQQGPVIGKMFGVLVVITSENEVGYLSAFSGKIGEKTHYDGYVPPIFDTLEEGGLVEQGMQRLARLNEQINRLELADRHQETEQLKLDRKSNSRELTSQIYAHYPVLNRYGEIKNLRTIFTGNPPGGAGECAAPKLLQYAFQNRMKPLGLAEFYWGKTTKSWKHKHFYKPCAEKCIPILKHMLKGL